MIRLFYYSPLAQADLPFEFRADGSRRLQSNGKANNLDLNWIHIPLDFRF